MHSEIVIIIAMKTQPRLQEMVVYHHSLVACAQSVECATIEEVLDLVVAWR